MYCKGVPQLRIESSILLQQPHCHAAVYADKIISPWSKVDQYRKIEYDSTLK